CHVSVPRDLEIPFGGPLRPRAGDESVVGADVLHLAVDDVVHVRAALVLAVPLEMPRPRRGLERRDLQRTAVYARIDAAGDGFAVPIQLEDDMCAIGGAGSPVAAPRAFERMAELG